MVMKEAPSGAASSQLPTIKEEPTSTAIKLFVGSSSVFRFSRCPLAQGRDGDHTLSTLPKWYGDIQLPVGSEIG